MKTGAVKDLGDARLPADFVPRNTVPRKPVARETDPFCNRPAARKLREAGVKVFREWKSGAFIRELSCKYRVRARDIENIIREVAA